MQEKLLIEKRLFKANEPPWLIQEQQNIDISNGKGWTYFAKNSLPSSVCFKAANSRSASGQLELPGARSPSSLFGLVCTGTGCHGKFGRKRCSWTGRYMPAKWHEAESKHRSLSELWTKIYKIQKWKWQSYDQYCYKTRWAACAITPTTKNTLIYLIIIYPKTLNATAKCLIKTTQFRSCYRANRISYLSRRQKLHMS